MKKKELKREIWILLAEETISREQYASFGSIGNGGAEAERWLGRIMRWLCGIQEEYSLDRKKQEMDKRTWGIFPQWHEKPGKYMEMMKQAVLLKSITAFS